MNSMRDLPSILLLLRQKSNSSEYSLGGFSMQYNQEPFESKQIAIELFRWSGVHPDVKIRFSRQEIHTPSKENIVQSSEYFMAFKSCEWIIGLDWSQWDAIPMECPSVDQNQIDPFGQTSTSELSEIIRVRPLRRFQTKVLVAKETLFAQKVQILNVFHFLQTLAPELSGRVAFSAGSQKWSRGPIQPKEETRRSPQSVHCVRQAASVIRRL
jgi:hypothetical protein